MFKNKISKLHSFLFLSLCALASGSSVAENYDVYVHGSIFDNCSNGVSNESSAEYGWLRYTNLPTISSNNRDSHGHLQKFLGYDGMMAFDSTNSCSANSVVTRRLDQLCSGNNTCRVICHSMGCLAVDNYLADKQVARSVPNTTEPDVNIEWVAAYGSASGGGDLAEHIYQAFRHMQGKAEGEEVEIRQCYSSERTNDVVYLGRTRAELCDATATNLDLTPGGSDYRRMEMSLAFRYNKARQAFDHDFSYGVPVFHIAGNQDDAAINVDEFIVPTQPFFDEQLHGENDGGIAFQSACGNRSLGVYTACNDGSKWTNHYIYQENHTDLQGNSVLDPLTQSYNLNHTTILGKRKNCRNWWGALTCDVDVKGIVVDEGTLDAPPAIERAVPGWAAEDISVNTNIVIDFNEPVQQSSLVVKLWDYARGQLGFSYQLDASRTRLTITPNAPFHNSAAILPVIEAAQDDNGNAIDTSLLTYFFTES